VENGKGEKRGKDNKQTKGRRRKIELIVFIYHLLSFIFRKPLRKKTFRPDD
jgi:hypothetical protein